MGMMLDNREQKLLYKLVVEELKSYGFDDEGHKVSGSAVRPSEILYVELLVSTLKRIKASVVREHRRAKRIAKTIERINQQRIEEDHEP